MGKRKFKMVGGRRRYKLRRPKGGKAMIGFGMAQLTAVPIHLGMAAGSAALGGPAGVAFAGYKLQSAARGLITGGALVRTGYRKRYYGISAPGSSAVSKMFGRKGKRGAKKGHKFYGNQYTKINVYTRGKRAAKGRFKARKLATHVASFGVLGGFGRRVK